MTVKGMTAEQLETYFEYLDTLRETGVTNMFGAGRWLENAFDLDRKEAREVLSGWMATFAKDKPASERAVEAQVSG